MEKICISILVDKMNFPLVRPILFGKKRMLEENLETCYNIMGQDQ